MKKGKSLPENSNRAGIHGDMITEIIKIGTEQLLGVEGESELQEPENYKWWS
jgi:hypothetical protein